MRRMNGSRQLTAYTAGRRKMGKAKEERRTGKKAELRVQYENIRTVRCKDCKFGRLLFFRLVFPCSRTRKIHGLNGLVYYFLYLSRPLCKSPKSHSLSIIPSRSFNFFFSFFYANSLPPSLLSPRLSFSYIYEIEKHTSHIYVLQYSLVYLHFFFGRLINSRVSHKIYDCLKISFD